jgi:antimicrobial peptide system SdpB family protein
MKISIEKILQNNTVTLARAFLASGTLLTLLFTGVDDLFPVHHLLGLKKSIEGLMHLNLFLWFDHILIPYLFSIAVLILTILGFFPRYISILHSWVTYSVFYTMLIVEGGDQINTILTFLIIPICLLDSRRNAWHKSNNVNIKKGFSYYNAKYSLLFITIQMGILYFNAGISKIFAAEWDSGTAVYYWFYDNMFGAPKWLIYIAAPLFTNDIPVTLINWLVILLELSLFVGLFLRQEYKYLLFTLGIFFHVLVILLHGLPTFFLAMAGGLILLFFQLDKSIKENIIQLKNSLILIIKKI